MEPPAFEPIPTARGVFPPGTKLFDVDGVPVCWLPRVGGGFVSMALDVMPPQLFSAAETFRRGKLIDAMQFEQLRLACKAGRPLPPSFPKGTLFLRLQRRVPVTIGRDGSVEAWDGPSPRPFSSRIAIEQGTVVGERTFRALVTSSRAAAVEFKERSRALAQALCDNLNRDVMAQAAREAEPERLAERLASEAIRRAQLRAPPGKWPA